MFNYWIQKHDYSAEEANNVTLSEAIRAFQSFDWASELGEQQEGVDGKDCSPGMGINNGIPLNEQGTFLHICPLNGEFVFFHFNYTKPEKFLGIFEFQRSIVYYVPKYP